MISTKGLMRIAWVCVSILLVALFIMRTAAQDDEFRVDTTSYLPSGLRALAQLLEKNGYAVSEVKFDAFYKPDKDTLDVVFGSFASEEELQYGLGRGTEKQFRDYIKDPELEWNTDRNLLEHTRAQSGVGGKILCAEINQSWQWSQEAADHFDRVAFSQDSNFSFEVTLGRESTSEYTSGYDSLPLWTSVSGSTIVHQRYYNGRNITFLTDSIPILNRFIGKAENAAFVLAIFRSIAPVGSKIRFVDTLGSNPSENRLDAVTNGAWSAVNTQFQFALICLIIFGSLRYGLPEYRRRVQTGTREMVDALGGILRRSRHERYALRIIYNHYDRKIRNKLKLSKDASLLQRNANLPPELQLALRSAEAVLTHDGATDTLDLVQQLQAGYRHFEGVRDSGRTRRKRKR